METNINELKKLAIENFENGGILYDLLEEGFYDEILKNVDSPKKQIKFLSFLSNYYNFINRNFCLLNYKKVLILNTINYVTKDFKKSLVNVFKKNVSLIKNDFTDFLKKIDINNNPFQKLVLLASCSFDDPYILSALVGKNDKADTDLWLRIINNYENKSLYIAKIL